MRSKTPIADRKHVRVWDGEQWANVVYAEDCREIELALRIERAVVRAMRYVILMDCKVKYRAPGMAEWVCERCVRSIRRKARRAAK